MRQLRPHLIVLACWLAACESNSSWQADASADADAGADADGPAAGDTAASDAPAATDTLTWLLALLNGPEAAITGEALLPRLSPALVQQLPADALASALRGLARTLAPMTVVSSVGQTPGTRRIALSTRGQMFVRLTLATSYQGGGTAQIEGLLFEPTPELDPSLRAPAAIAERLRALAPRTSLLLAAPEGAGCRPLHALAADSPMPLGSIFKLYVLGALVARIEAGQSRWDDLWPIREAWKSLPSGDLQDVDAGTPLPLSTYATKMISISDNTATDHLLHLVGRAQVEAQQTLMGHQQPQLNVPFVTTRELFVMKLMLSPEERQAYLRAPVPERRRLLDEVYAEVQAPADLGERVAAWTTPRDIDTLEWFASANDVCRALGALKTAGERPAGAPALAALAVNPGLNVDRGAFSYVGFKGGSEPGVLTASWLLRRTADQAYRVVTVMTADDQHPIAEFPVLYFALAAVQAAARL